MALFRSSLLLHHSITPLHSSTRPQIKHALFRAATQRSVTQRNFFSHPTSESLPSLPTGKRLRIHDVGSVSASGGRSIGESSCRTSSHDRLSGILGGAMYPVAAVFCRYLLANRVELGLEGRSTVEFRVGRCCAILCIMIQHAS